MSDTCRNCDILFDRADDAQKKVAELVSELEKADALANKWQNDWATLLENTEERVRVACRFALEQKAKVEAQNAALSAQLAVVSDLNDKHHGYWKDSEKLLTASTERAEQNAHLMRKLADALEVFENRRKLAHSLRAEAPQVAAFVEAIGVEMDKHVARQDQHVHRYDVLDGTVCSCGAMNPKAEVSSNDKSGDENG